MENKAKTASKTQKHKHHSHLIETASEILQEGKKKVNEFYEESRHKVDATEKAIGEYSEELVKTIKENPLRSVLIAAGVGFVLSALLRK